MKAVRLILLILVVLLAVDALYFDGGYTQSVYRESSAAAARLANWADAELDEGDAAPQSEPTQPRSME